MPPIVAASWWETHQDRIVGVVVPLAVAAVLVLLLERVVGRRVAALAQRMQASGRGLSRDAITRMRFARRALEATIVVVAVMLALSEIEGLRGLARAVLTSGAITAAIVGFAARQTVANVIAGIMLAVVQPLRIGDVITFSDQTGTVEDIGLTYTRLRTGADARILIPNEQLASAMIRNDSIHTSTVSTQVSVWIAADADERRALEALEALGVSARIAEMTPDALRIDIIGQPGSPNDRIAREAKLRADALQALREAGLR